MRLEIVIVLLVVGLASVPAESQTTTKRPGSGVLSPEQLACQKEVGHMQCIKCCLTKKWQHGSYYKDQCTCVKFTNPPIPTSNPSLHPRPWETTAKYDGPTWGPRTTQKPKPSTSRRPDDPRFTSPKTVDPKSLRPMTQAPPTKPGNPTAPTPKPVSSSKGTRSPSRRPPVSTRKPKPASSSRRTRSPSRRPPVSTRKPKPVGRRCHKDGY